jgi:hypothetical protein
MTPYTDTFEKVYQQYPVGYAVYKHYPHKVWLVGYYRTKADANVEIAYIETFERECWPTWCTYEPVVCADLPMEVLAKWSFEDNQLQMDEVISLPLLRKPWPRLFSDFLEE